MLFLGTYYHSLDDKNRLILPAKMAAKFDGVLVVSKGFEGCLEVRTKFDFEYRSNQLLALSENKKDSRIISRQFFANSSELEIDKANRILIPNHLKQLASLNKDVILIGLGNKIEIWDTSKYSEFKNQTDGQFEAVAERLENE